MKILTLEELFTFACLNSPFYKNQFKNFSLKDWKSIPPIVQEEFWEKNTWQNNQVLTGPIQDGIVFKSGGTTGKAKFSIFTQDEWNLFTKEFGIGMAKGGLKQGERVANLFYAGDLYASFLFIMKSMENAPVNPLHFPIGGAVEAEQILKTIHDYGIETIAGVPTTLLSLTSYMEEKSESNPKIKRILFGGESMYADQRKTLQAIFPKATIQSIGYASVDAGQLGYVGENFAPDIHSSFGTSTIFELYDPDTKEYIEETGRVGKVIFTNLSRKLMPIIKYPAGDIAEWIDPPGTKDRRFILKGRAEEGARVGPTTLYYEDIQKVLENFSSTIGSFQFQLIITHHELKDELEIRIHASNHEAKKNENEILVYLYQSRPMLIDMVQESKIHMPRFSWVKADELMRNTRTGKLRRIIDERFN